MRKNALSLAEVLLGLGLVSLLLSAAFFCFAQGLKMWSRTDQTRDLVEGARLAVENLEKDVQRSCYASLSVDGEALSVASALDPNGQFALQSHGQPQWLGYILYFRQPSSAWLVRREERAPGPLAAPVPLETTFGDSLANHLLPGRRLTPYVGNFEVAVVDRGIHYRLHCLRSPQGRQAAAPFTFEGDCQFRNEQ